MAIPHLNIIPFTLLAQYVQLVDKDLQAHFNELKDAEISTSSFSFYTSVSAIASSRIEGEPMEVDSYIKYKMQQAEYQPDLVQKPDDLYKAYLFAQQNKLTVVNFLAAHQLITTHLLPAHKQGAFRTGNMVVMEHKTGRIQLRPPPPWPAEAADEHAVARYRFAKAAAIELWRDILFRVLYSPCVCNHPPFEDGNGRAGRLLEKWFIAEKLGPKAWYLQSELNYYTHVGGYYKNLNRLGIFYEHLDYGKAMPFLFMLVDS